jgi:hypothetical protein
MSSSPTNKLSNGQNSRRVKANGSVQASPSKNSAASDSIKVVVRLRPMNSAEKKHGTLPVIKASTNDKTVTVIKGQGSRQVRSSFSFDHVFTAFSTQLEVFEDTLKPLVE